MSLQEDIQLKRKLSDFSSYGKLMILIGILIFTPVLVVFFYPEDLTYIISFILPAFLSVLLGLLVCLIGKKECEESFERQSLTEKSSLVVLFAWTWGVLFGALPFIFAGKLKIIQAIFESVSGWTTTGLSVMDVSLTPKIFLFHRSFMQFCGGLGFIMMMIMLVSGKTSMNLFNAEGHPDKLMPNLKKTARTIFAMYNLYLIIGIIAYKLAGMGFFDGICHSMCSLSTGGFSTKLASIGEYNSVAINIVTIVLMLIGTTNFAVLLLLSRKKIKQAFNVSEVKFMFILLFIFIPLVSLSLMRGMGMSFSESMTRSSFDLISALSTTGYSSMAYTKWPHFAIAILILMMLIGGGIGSTAGGLKLTRVYLILKMTLKNIRKRLSPAQTISSSYYIKAQGKEKIDTSLEEDTVGFIISYMFIYVIGALLICAIENCGLMEAMFEFASAIGTVGLSIGITGPSTKDMTLIVEIAGMLLGRLEIFIVFIGICSGIKIIKRKINKNT